ncbi:protease inhibitor I42 family protein [Streptomyces sp. HNM0574]|uniref:protease inhibitor I42 family protein n=1 Tax=Streptomyces sp. HNM0574 TaxID=2714954 RepID=UPI00146E7737|nr:protease inhibitor I42 family protein [Streptomyces sp. HNM0574]NLU69172.1 protease inhibitor I42 family protein [Streptomyces sp. HNM0574]
MRQVPARLVLPAVLAAALSGCGLSGPEEYALGEKAVTVDEGEEFTLSVPVDIAMGEHWSTTSPEPDASVVRGTGDEEDAEDSGEADGAGKGTHRFTFKAVGTGTTKIRLIQCPHRACAGGGTAGGPVTASPVPSGSPSPPADERATVHTYTVTVRQP